MEIQSMGKAIQLADLNPIKELRDEKNKKKHFGN